MLWLKFEICLSAHIPGFEFFSPKLQYFPMIYDVKILKKIVFSEPPRVFLQHTHLFGFCCLGFLSMRIIIHVREKKILLDCKKSRILLSQAKWLPSVEILLKSVFVTVAHFDFKKWMFSSGRTSHQDANYFCAPWK